MNSFYVATFYSTHLALEFEKLLKKNKIETKLIPVPRRISSSCGIAAKIKEDCVKQVCLLCRENEVEYDNIYKIFDEKGQKVQSIEKII